MRTECVDCGWVTRQQVARLYNYCPKCGAEFRNRHTWELKIMTGNDGMWYCRECRTVIAGKSYKPPERPCPVCGADRTESDGYARAGP